MGLEILDEEVFHKKRKLDYANFIVRSMSYLVDIIPIIVVVNIAFYFLFGLRPFGISAIYNSNGEMLLDAPSTRILSRYTSLIIWIVYSALMDASTHQGTFGKQNSKIRVVDKSGNRISMKQSILRNSMKIISYLPLGLGFFWAAFDKHNRTLHDIIAGTYVVENEAIS